jgi:hypothetical protein
MSSDRKFGKLLERVYRGEDLDLSYDQQYWFARLEDLRSLLSRIELDADDRADYLRLIDDYEFPPRSTAGRPSGSGDSEARLYVGGLADIGERDYRAQRGRQRISLPILNAIYTRAIDMVERQFPHWRGEIERPQGKRTGGNDIRDYNWQWSPEMERQIDIVFPDAERQMRAAWQEAEAAARKRRARVKAAS